MHNDAKRYSAIVECKHFFVDFYSWGKRHHQVHGSFHCLTGAPICAPQSVEQWVNERQALICLVELFRSYGLTAVQIAWCELG